MDVQECFPNRMESKQGSSAIDSMIHSTTAQNQRFVFILAVQISRREPLLAALFRIGIRTF